ncbi:MAG: Branched-chain amino acid transport system / permease component [Firmicutes bacterium ADurb.Bin080]|nr:MAG: Branched-chain amino acid transport system / permease component [Firmicutes bacterium ADurb.Bin080]
MFKTKREPLFHLVKRIDVSKKYAWAVRIGAFLLSILVCAAISSLLTDKSIGFFFKYLFNGTFGTKRTIWNLFHETAILLLVSIAVTPCFKMKFWNIGGEGQILMGALGCSVALVFMGGKSSDGATIVVSLILAFVFGIAWAVIPAFFKARWNTNETLLTLMMNYIAVCLVNYFIKSVASSSTGTLTFKDGLVEPIGGNQFILFIIVSVVLTVLMWVYLKYSKHGYELTVVGESENTSRYVGINNKLVIIRTLILCGALCGLIGFLLVSGVNHSLGDATVEGRGFTGLLISWLAHFNPLAMGLTSFLFVFIDNGASQVSNYARLGASYPKVMTGIFFLFIIATEFFINYKIVFKKMKLKEISSNGDKDIDKEVKEPQENDIDIPKDDNNAQEGITEMIIKEKI